MSHTRRVIFICTANAARSQMAEALLGNMRPDTYDIYSAGTDPTGVDPRALAALDRLSVDTEGLHSKSIDEYLNEHFDYVVALCNKAQAECKALPGAGEFMAWDFEDPQVSDSPTAFRKTLQEIQQRVQMFLLVTEKD